MKQKLILTSDTFLWRKSNNALLYHAGTGEMFRFNIVGQIETLCRQFEDIDNLYSVDVDIEEMDYATRDLIKEIDRRGFGHLLPIDAPIISLPPMLNLQHDLERLRRNKDFDAGQNVLAYLSTLTIYVGGICRNKSYYKQIIYPICSEERLSAQMIRRFIDAAWSQSLHTINLVVSDASDPGIGLMKQILMDIKDHIIFYFLFTDLNTIPYELVDAGYKVRLICESADNLMENHIQMNHVVETRRLHGRVGYDLLVRSEQEYEFWNKFIEEYKVEDYNMIPVFDNNLEFFKRNVFMDESDFSECRISRREVFAHQVLNTGAFGRLTVMPDGKVYSDVTEPALGTKDDSIHDLIIRELENNYAWRKIRNSTKCKQCIYQWLCPSPTLYEKIAGEYTICNFN